MKENRMIFERISLVILFCLGALGFGLPILSVELALSCKLFMWIIQLP